MVDGKLCVTRGYVLAAVAVFIVGCGDSGSNASGGTTGLAPTELFALEHMALHLDVDGEWLYYTTGGSLYRISIAGGQPTELSRAPSETFALDETHAYFPGGITGTISKVDKSGGTPVSIVTGQKEPTDIAVDASGVYWANWSSWMDAPIADGSIVRADKDGSNVTPLAEQLVYPRSLAIDATSLYWASANRDEVLKLDKSGGTPVVLSADQYSPNGLLLDDMSVYFRTDQRPSEGGTADGELVKLSKSGGAPNVLLTDRNLGRIALNAGFIYLTLNEGGTSCTRKDGKILRIPVDGGAATPIVIGQTEPFHIQTDGRSLYWTNGTAGSTQCKALMKAAL